MTLFKKNSETNKNLERRKFFRIPSVLPVSLKVNLSKNSSYEGLKQTNFLVIQGYTKDLSKGGLCFEFKKEGTKIGWLEKNLTCEISIEMPTSDKDLCLNGTLAWSHVNELDNVSKWQLGISFDDPSHKNVSSVINYASRSKRKPYFWGGVIITIFLCLAFSMYEKSSVDKSLKKSRHVIHQLSQSLSETLREKTILEKQQSYISRSLALSKNKLKDKEKRIIDLAKETQDLEKNSSKLGRQIRELEQELQTKVSKNTQNNSDSSLKLKINKLKKSEEDAKKLAGELFYKKELLEEDLKMTLVTKKSLEKELSILKTKTKALESDLNKVYSLDNWTVYQIVLKNGHILVGEMIAATETTINFKVSNGTFELRRDQIKTMEELNLLSKKELEKKWREEESKAQLRNQKRFKTKIAEAIKKDPKVITKPNKKTTILPPKVGISVIKDRLYVNGKLFYVKGINYGIEYPKVSGGMKMIHRIPDGVIEKDFKMIAQAGINVIRTYEPLSAPLLDLAHKYQLKVIETICYPTGGTDYGSNVHLEFHLEKALKTVRDHRKHPAILMWSLYNDAPWVWGKSGNPFDTTDYNKISSFIEKIYIEVKKIDKKHPITGANVLGFKGSNLGFDFLDILGFNAYIGGLDWFLEEDALKTVNELNHIRKKFNKPIIITETGFSTFVHGLDQNDILKKQARIIGESFAGVVFFQWADGWDKAGYSSRQDYHIEEHWGIVTGYRELKSGYHAVKELFLKLPDDSMGFKIS